MKPISKSARAATEALVKALLADSKKRAGGAQIPTNDADYAEAFGVIRGCLAATYGNASAEQPIRLAEGHGPATHESARKWLGELRDAVGA